MCMFERKQWWVLTFVCLIAWLPSACRIINCTVLQGNQRFRKLVAARAEDYAAASTRTDKTFIVCSIVSEIRKASPRGGFVKKDSTTGRWYEVGDFNAHEKTSQMFRDVLHENYLSSNKSKKKRRDLFRTNSKRRALMQQQQAAKSINASAGRFLRRNGVARHHSYGSVKRAVGMYSSTYQCTIVQG